MQSSLHLLAIEKRDVDSFILGSLIGASGQHILPSSGRLHAQAGV